MYEFFVIDFPPPPQSECLNCCLRPRLTRTKVFQHKKCLSLRNKVFLDYKFYRKFKDLFALICYNMSFPKIVLCRL